MEFYMWKIQFILPHTTTKKFLVMFGNNSSPIWQNNVKMIATVKEKFSMACNK